jgi:hypothetical protein
MIKVLISIAGQRHTCWLSKECTYRSSSLHLSGDIGPFLQLTGYSCVPFRIAESFEHREAFGNSRPDSMQEPYVKKRSCGVRLLARNKFGSYQKSRLRFKG